MTEAMEHIDQIISNMNAKRHIIYFKSENRHIIQTVIDQSAALQEKLCMYGKISKPPKTGWYHMLCGHKRCVDLMQVFQFHGFYGTIDVHKFDRPPLVLFLADFQIYPEQYRGYLLKAFLDCKALEHSYLLISSPQLHIPDGFSSEIEFILDRYISRRDIEGKLIRQVRLEEEKRRCTFFTDDQLGIYARDFVGLTEEQVDTVLMRMEGTLCTGLKSSKHLDKIADEKKKEAEKDPTIKFLTYANEESVAGLGHYSKWLSERKSDFQNPINAKKEGTPAPKGVLLCGVPGTGKTAMAKETARCLGVPLIQFDISRIQTKDFGGSEERLRRYLERICAFGSCVMLMDEVEKVFAVNESTHEVKRTMLSLLLDWMQAREANVFTFITANDISSLPPELLRDGRINGRFFAFMPSRDDLCDILCLKLKPLAESYKINQEFRHLLERPMEQENPFAGMFDEIAKRAKAVYRFPFMTGANVENLVEMTNLAIRKETSPPYSVEEYTQQMINCALSFDFVPQGQSNMDDLVSLWMAAQKRHYQDVSDHTLLPFGQFMDGKFVELPESASTYDSYLREVLRERIERK